MKGMPAFFDAGIPISVTEIRPVTDKRRFSDMVSMIPLFLRERHKEDRR